MKKTLLPIILAAISLNLSASGSNDDVNNNLLTLKSSSTVPTFIELYTSQGCSSCPPADKYLNSLKQHKGLFKDFIPMAFHVDYWDYLGWKDPFASSQNSERQRIYRARNKSNSVYTPQFIVSDQEWRGFFKRRKANTNSVYQNPNTLTVKLDGQNLQAEYSAAATDLLLHTALLGIGTETRIPRGENAGKTLKQDFVVLSHDIKRSSSNRWQITIPAPKATIRELALVSWITSEDDSKPLQAVAGPIPLGVLK